MKKALLLLTCLFASQTNASLLTFEDIQGGSIQNQFGSMPTYKGFNFSYGLNWIDLVDPPLRFGNRGTYSGDFAIFYDNRVFGERLYQIGTITEENGADFTFEGFWAKHWFTRINSGEAGASITGNIEGYKDGALAWTMPASLNGSYKYFGAQIGSIDELRIDFGVGIYLIDNLELTTVSPVPEPSSIALMLGGLGLIGFMVARRTTKV